MRATSLHFHWLELSFAYLDREIGIVDALVQRAKTSAVHTVLFVVHGVRPDSGGIQDAIRGGLLYAVIMLLFAALLIVVPELVTWLPENTRRY